MRGKLLRDFQNLRVDRFALACPILWARYKINAAGNKTRCGRVRNLFKSDHSILEGITLVLW